MDDDDLVTWRQWWRLRPWRPRPQKRVVPFFRTKQEEEDWKQQCIREYYDTHRSARLARWGVALGVVIVIVGFFLTFTFSGATVHAGYGVMVFGVLFVIISMRYTAMLAS